MTPARRARQRRRDRRSLTLSTSRPRLVGCRPSASFAGIDALEDRVGVEVLRQRQLHDVAVAAGVGVELVDERLDLGLRGVGRQLALDRVHADRLGLAVLHADVQLRRRVGARRARSRCPGTMPRAFSAATRSRSSSLISAAAARPSSFCAVMLVILLSSSRPTARLVAAPRRRGVAPQSRRPSAVSRSGADRLLLQAGVEREGGGERGDAGAERLDVGVRAAARAR